jgi:hypothetical protein
MTDWPNIKEDLNLEFIEYTSFHIKAQDRGSVNANPHNYGLAACSYLALTSNDGSGLFVSKPILRNGIKLFNILTKSSVTVNF